jgi:hypothetical protein
LEVKQASQEEVALEETQSDADLSVLGVMG